MMRIILPIKDTIFRQLEDKKKIR